MHSSGDRLSSGDCFGAVAATESNWSTPFIGLVLDSFGAAVGIDSEIPGVELFFFTDTELLLSSDSVLLKCGIVWVGLEENTNLRGNNIVFRKRPETKEFGSSCIQRK